MTLASRRLLLLRHAEAARPPKVEDHERPLTALGLEQSNAVGMHMQKEEWLPECAIVSTSVRTRSTWEQVQKKLPAVVPAIFEKRVYEASPEALLEVIQGASATHKTLVLVGHNPGLHSLSMQLVGRADRNAYGRLRHEFPPGSLVVLDFQCDSWKEVVAHTGLLNAFITPVDINS